jgi:hypothetical protein
MKLAVLLKMSGLGSGRGMEQSNQACPSCGSSSCNCDQMDETYGDTAETQNSPDYPTNTETSGNAMQYSGGIDGPKSTGQATVPVLSSQEERTGMAEGVNDDAMAGLQKTIDFAKQHGYKIYRSPTGRKMRFVNKTIDHEIRASVDNDGDSINVNYMDMTNGTSGNDDASYFDETFKRAYDETLSDYEYRMDDQEERTGMAENSRIPTLNQLLKTSSPLPKDTYYMVQGSVADEEGRDITVFNIYYNNKSVSGPYYNSKSATRKLRQLRSEGHEDDYDDDADLRRMMEMAGIQEAKKPDFLDKDGDKKKPMKKAIDDKDDKKVKESIFDLTNQWKTYKAR